MQTRLHLVSMPWANPELPSIQTAVLKAYVDETFGGRVPTRTYSAFASLLLEETRQGPVDLFDRYQAYEEYPYFLLYLRRFLRQEQGLERVSLERLLQRVNAHVTDAGEPLTLRGLAHLERRTQRYVRETIGPQLSRRALNVVGFTLNYYQLYASLYCARALRESFPEHEFLFLFGGATVIYPKVAELLERLGIEGFCIIGEGERKLELVLREILATPARQRAKLSERLAALHAGIYDIQRRTLNLHEPNPALLLSLQTPVDSLPLPDFDEYYASLRRALPGEESHAQFRSATWIAMEGTRGCFAKCDFCDVHSSWSGFRKGTPQRIVDRALALVRKHRSARIKFMDNVCDTWAEEYADYLIERKIRITCFMENRVHHPEVFWTKLSLSGVELVQVGIEALAPTLLRAMNKGTRAKQNLLVQKWLRELGIKSLSNLISHHPKSTLEHVRETRQILELIPHLDRLDFSPLALLINTPLDRRLEPEERRRLTERQLFALPRSLDRFFVAKGEYEPPDQWFGEGVPEAWDELIAWEESFSKQCGEEAVLAAEHCGSEEILVRDGRFGKVEEHFLEGEAARAYDLCHQGASLEALARELELPLEAVQGLVAGLIERRLMVNLEDCCISLALRPRDELVANCVALASQRSSGPRAVPELALAS